MAALSGFLMGSLREILGEKAREVVLRKYDLKATAARYRELCLQLAGRG